MNYFIPSFLRTSAASSSLICGTGLIPTFGSGPNFFFRVRSSVFFTRLYSRRSSSSRIARYFAWFRSLHPPSISSILRPSKVLVLLSGSGARNKAIALRVASTDTTASLARPGILANTRPFLSAIANIVIQTTFVSGSSTHNVEDVIEENNLVKVKLIDCQTMSANCLTVNKCQHNAEADALTPQPPCRGRRSL